jgi:hypothetical protein
MQLIGILTFKKEPSRLTLHKDHNMKRIPFGLRMNDMKKYLFAILILLFAMPCEARMSMAVVGGGVAAAPAYTEELFYNADHATNTETAYTVNRTSSAAGTEGVTITQPVGATDPGTASADGGNVIKIGSWSARITFAVTAKDIFDSAQGLVSLEYYNAASTGTNELFRVYVDSDEKLLMSVTAANTLYCRHDSPGGGGTIAQKTSTATFADSTWVTLQCRWDAAADTISVKVGSNAWEDSTGNTNMTAFTTEPATISIGTDDNGFANVPGYIDGFKIWTTYDGS